MIRVHVDSGGLHARLTSLAARLEDLRPAMEQVGEYLAEAAKRRFRDSKAPDGSRWAPNSPVTLLLHAARYQGSFSKRDGRPTKRGAARMAAKKPLIGESKSLSTQIHYRAESRQVTVFSLMEYAATQQFGAKKGAFGRTRRGAPIPWGDIPARPFLGFADADRPVIERALIEHLTGRYDQLQRIKDVAPTGNTGPGATNGSGNSTGSGTAWSWPPTPPGGTPTIRPTAGAAAAGSGPGPGRSAGK